MWLLLEDQSRLKVSPVTDRLTIGTAPSNGLILEGRGIRPLHGQIAKREKDWIFRDFVSETEISILPKQKFNLGNWSCELLTEEDLYSQHQQKFVDLFRGFLKTSKEFNLSDSLARLRQEVFFQKNLPENLQRRLEHQHQEISLLGPIERLLMDQEVTDILVESFDLIWIERRGCLEKSDLKFTSTDSFRIYVENLLSQLHKSVDEAHPYADFVLKDGSRGHIIGPPLTPHSYYLSIRKPREKVWLLDDLEERGMLNFAQRGLVDEAVSKKLNILVSGATGSGKTTFLKALIAATAPEDRVLILEDTPELGLPRLNTSFLRTRLDARSELPPVSLRELVRQSLRMRPDRIVVGEVRGDEALDLLHAMNTGHRGCLGSLHANSARDALSRLEGLVQLSEKSLSENATRDLLARNIHLVIHCAKVEGARRIQEMGFVRGVDGNRILMEVL